MKVRQNKGVFYPAIVEVLIRMPYLTNNQRMELGLEGACCVKPETLEKADTSNVYVDEEEQQKLLGKKPVVPDIAPPKKEEKKAVAVEAEE